MMKHLFYSLSLLLIPSLALGQDASDYMNNIGKIYVVAGVMLILFFSIILFLIYLERKISKLEKITALDEN